MLNTTTNEKRARGIKKAKRIKRKQMLKSLKNYLGMGLLFAIYYLSKYGFSFNLMEVDFGDFLLVGFTVAVYLVAFIFKLIATFFKMFISLFREEKPTIIENSINAKLVSVKFSDYMSGGKLSRKQILEFKEVINKLLPKDQVNYYKKSKYKFTNDAHEIFIKLKNTNLKESDAMILMNQLNLFQKEKKQLENTVRRPYHTSQVANTKS